MVTTRGAVLLPPDDAAAGHERRQGAHDQKRVPAGARSPSARDEASRWPGTPTGLPVAHSLRAIARRHQIHGVRIDGIFASTGVGELDGVRAPAAIDRSIRASRDSPGGSDVVGKGGEVGDPVVHDLGPRGVGQFAIEEGDPIGQAYEVTQDLAPLRARDRCGGRLVLREAVLIALDPGQDRLSHLCGGGGVYRLVWERARRVSGRPGRGRRD
jgi:hypothetical protein